MEKKEFKKYFNAQVEALFERFNSTQIFIIEYSKNIANIKFMSETVGKIEFIFLTGKQLSMGAMASIFITANIFGGEIWKEILERDELKKKNSNLYTNYLYYFYSSSSKNNLFKNSKTDFFSSDNIEEKLCKLLDFISKELLSKIFNILMKKAMAIDNILDTPNYYGQPEISMLLLCRNNPKEQLLSAIEEDKRFLNSSDINKKIWEENKSLIFSNTM
jgi:hypothetical protein